MAHQFKKWDKLEASHQASDAQDEFEINSCKRKNWRARDFQGRRERERYIYIYLYIYTESDIRDVDDVVDVFGLFLE